MFDISLRPTFGGWNETKRERLSDASIAQVEKAVVEEWQYGLALNLYIKGGNGAYKSFGLHRDSKLSLGDKVDLTKGQVVTLSKVGESDTYRWLED